MFIEEKNVPKMIMVEKVENEKLFKNCKIVFSNAQYVSDAIREDYYTKWTPATPIFISAQTGAGKNTFIEKVLIENLVPRKNKVLILSNRIALGRQEKGRIAVLMDRIEPRPSGTITYRKDVERRNGEMLDELEDFGSVTIKSYQGLRKRPEVLKEVYDYVILDECHFFLADAKFNKFTFSILEDILDMYSDAVRVYMTATLSDVFIPIMKRELKERDYGKVKHYELEASKRLPPSLWGQNWSPAFWRSNLLTNGGDEHEAYFEYNAVVYEMERKFDHVCCRYLKAKAEKTEATTDDFSAREILIEFIKKQIKEDGGKRDKDKWLIFVSSISAGKELRDAIGPEFATLITAKAKKQKTAKEDPLDDSKEIYQEICEKEKFSKKVVITTPVLDNGINIEDPNLKNIAILVFDKVCFMQMLGRKRIIGGEKINLYIQEYNAATINSRLNWDGGVRANLRRISLYKSNPQEIGNEIFSRDPLFYWADNNYDKLAYNPFAEEKLKCEEAFYEKILSEDMEEETHCLSYDNYMRQLKNETPLKSKQEKIEERTIIEQLSWLGLEHEFSPQNYVEFENEEEKAQKKLEAREELVNFLEHSSISICIPEHKEEADSLFLKKGKKRDEQECFKKRFKELALKAFGRRENDKSPNRVNSFPVINEILLENALPYEIVTRSIREDRTSVTLWLLKKLK